MRSLLTIAWVFAVTFFLGAEFALAFDQTETPNLKASATADSTVANEFQAICEDSEPDTLLESVLSEVVQFVTPRPISNFRLGVIEKDLPSVRRFLVYAEFSIPPPV